MSDDIDTMTREELLELVLIIRPAVSARMILSARIAVARRKWERLSSAAQEVARSVIPAARAYDKAIVRLRTEGGADAARDVDAAKAEFDRLYPPSEAAFRRAEQAWSQLEKLHEEARP